MIVDIWILIVERREFFLGLLLEHMKISLIAIGLAIVLGGLIGIVISEYQKTTKTTLAVINFLYTIPSISMLGFLIPFSGVGNVTAIIALTMYALLPMVRNTHTGMVTIEPGILEAAKGMGSTRMQMLYKIKIPLAMPVIMSGIRNMVTMTIALAGIASFIGAGGLGVAIYRGITTNNSVMTIVGSALIACLALFADILLGIVEKQMQKRTNKAKKRKYFYGSLITVLCVAIFGNILYKAPAVNSIRVATKPM
jgi:ABC-type proline/glycine betaine transport systems, permease component